MMKPSLWSGGEPALDIDGPKSRAGNLKQEIDLGPSAGPVKAGNRPIGGRRDQVLDDKAFPTCPHYRVPREGVVIGDAKQGMHDPAIANIDLRGLDEPLTRVAMIRPQAQH